MSCEYQRQYCTLYRGEEPPVTSSVYCASKSRILKISLNSDFGEISLHSDFGADTWCNLPFLPSFLPSSPSCGWRVRWGRLRGHGAGGGLHAALCTGPSRQLASRSGAPFWLRRGPQPTLWNLQVSSIHLAWCRDSFSKNVMAKPQCLHICNLT